jgi:hypothetical protein
LGTSAIPVAAELANPVPFATCARLIIGDTTMLAGYIPTCATDTNDVTGAADNVADSGLTTPLRATGIPASTVWNWPANPANPPTGSRLDSEDTNEDRKFPNPDPNPARPTGGVLNDGNVAATDVAPA